MTGFLKIGIRIKVDKNIGTIAFLTMRGFFKTMVISLVSDPLRLLIAQLVNHVAIQYGQQIKQRSIQRSKVIAKELI